MDVHQIWLAVGVADAITSDKCFDRLRVVDSVGRKLPFPTDKASRQGWRYWPAREKVQEETDGK